MNYLVGIGLGEADDPTILAWAATEGRLVLTHDAATLIGYAYARIAAGRAMPGIIEVRQDLPIGSAIEDLPMRISCASRNCRSKPPSLDWTGC